MKKEQAAHAALRKEVDEARAATAKLQQALEKAQAVLQAERAAGGDRGKDLAAAKDALEQELKREQAAHAKIRKEFENARAATEAERTKKEADLEHALKQAETRAVAAEKG